MFKCKYHGCEQVIVQLIDWGFNTNMKNVRLIVSIQTIMVIEIYILSI